MRPCRPVRVAFEWLAVPLAALVTAGCMSGGVDALRIAPYRPVTERGGEWYAQAHPSQMEQTEVATAAQPVVPASAVPVVALPQPVGATPDPPAEDSKRVRALEKGDRVTIQINGPEPARIEDVIDELGTITLPHIGDVVLAGRTTAEVESSIEKAYIDGKFYKYVNVIVVSLDDEFFVRGEVNKEGRFPLTGNMTLGKALIVAGGYTEFAKPTEIVIRRGNEVLTFDMKKIDRGETPDPVLRRGDVIVVPRRWVW